MRSKTSGTRMMAETAALLADEVFPDVPLRQWVIRFPLPLRHMFAAHPQVIGKVLSIVYRAIATRLIHKAGFQVKDGATGAVTLIQLSKSVSRAPINLGLAAFAGSLLAEDQARVLFTNVNVFNGSDHRLYAQDVPV